MKFRKIRMRLKRLMLILISCIIGSIIYWQYQNSAAHFHTFVSKTQVHIQHINSKLKELDRSEDKKELDVESTYLELLGFLDNPKLFNISNYSPNDSLVFLTAFTHYTDREKELIESKLKYFPDDIFIIYDIDLSFTEQLKVSYSSFENLFQIFNKNYTTLHQDSKTM